MKLARLACTQLDERLPGRNNPHLCELPRLPLQQLPTPLRHRRGLRDPRSKLKTRTITKTSAALGLVEAAHDGNGDWQAWSERLLEGAKPLFTSTMVNLGIARRRERHFEFMAGASDNLKGLYEYYRAQVPSIPVADVEPLWRFPRLVSTLSGILGATPHARHVEEFTRVTGAPDVLGLVAIVDDVSLSLGAPHPARIQLGAAERRLLARVTLHVEAGLRLRLHPGSEVAVLRPDGHLLHAEGNLRDKATIKQRLSHHVDRVEKGRRRSRRQSSDAVTAWQALISGRWGLVERVEADGKRFYAIVETPRATRLQALTQLEAEVLELTARGLTGKAVGYALGIGHPLVSMSLANAAMKLGVRSRTELVGLVAQLLGLGKRREADHGRITKAERDVLSLVRLGWQNAAIAAARGRSERTVANQVASLLQKLKVPSRRALAAAVL